MLFGRKAPRKIAPADVKFVKIINVGETSGFVEGEVIVSLDKEKVKGYITGFLTKELSLFFGTSEGGKSAEGALYNWHGSKAGWKFAERL